ncbi:YdcF family protein [Stenomitos frigidus]|uniref:YdcF family protein n=1 Tax=Stenomitos frigidus ULC18 TaxID=2107698 RepID=A0A2T1DXD0_9CYAN|nr:YdcF family protein [Stenomitos frigidus]PSB25158.1 YdcF family protein [Stenomitos frigidus ULC18]
MLDSASCPRSHSKWVSFTWLISGRLTQPLPLSVRITLLALLVLVVVGLVWALRKPSQRQRIRLWSRRLRWYRRRTHVVVALTLACLLITSPPGLALVTHALTSQIPADSGAKAEAIVVLGRGARFMNDRVDVTAALWQAKRAPLIFVSGRGDAKRITRQLLEKGIPSDVLDGENCSLTTEENAQFTADLLIPKGMKQIILVTDAPHMLRSRLTFQSLGFDVIAHPNDLPSNLGYREHIELVAREYGGILSYVLRGRFHEREAAELKDVHAFADRELS